MPSKPRKFTPEFKLKMVKLYEGGTSRVDIERKYNLKSDTLRLWIKNYQTTGSVKSKAKVEEVLVELCKENHNYEEYQALSLLTYDEAVKFLLEKYGPGFDDYYRENSYSKFMNGEIKSIAKGKFARTREGLYCHHIDEDKMENLSNIDFIKSYNVPYSYQKKDRLVYCDLIEHCILHGLIAKESDNEWGLNGLEAYLIPMVEEWYIEGRIPKPNWMKNCYNKSFLTPENAKNILVDILNLVNIDYLDRIRQRQIRFENLLRKYKEEVRENLLNSLKPFDYLTETSDRESIVYAMRNLQHGYTCYEQFNENPNVLPNFFNYYSRSEDYKTMNSRMIQFPKEQILQDALDLIDKIDWESVRLNK